MRIVPLILLGVVILIGVGMSGRLQVSEPVRIEPENLAKPSIIVIRVDDIQDYAFRDAQLWLLRYSRVNKIPLSLAIIPELVVSDKELIASINDALREGAEVSAHGWSHEDFYKLLLEEQAQRLIQAKSSLRSLFGVNVTVFVPPMFMYNNDTFAAMRKGGYDTLSSSIDLQKPERRSDEVVCLPATVEYSDFVNGTWRIKSIDELLYEVDLSVESYGYAVIVLHPQEFMKGSEINDDVLRIYTSLVNIVGRKYSFTTLGELSKTIK